MNNAYETGEQWQHVLDLVKNMRCESVQRDAVTYSANISASIMDKIWYVNIINGIKSWRHSRGVWEVQEGFQDAFAEHQDLKRTNFEPEMDPEMETEMEPQ